VAEGAIEVLTYLTYSEEYLEAAVVVAKKDKEKLRAN